MKGLRHIVGVVVAGLIVLVACKKNTTHVNSEKDFTLYFKDKDTTILNKCFDKVYGQGKAGLSSCSNFRSGLQLPMNIDSDSSRFYFVKGNKTDTLTICYQRSYEGGGPEFEVIYTITRLSYSFDSLTTQCIPGLNLTCNGNDAYHSATVIY
jgi:hypothetical protein